MDPGVKLEDAVILGVEVGGRVGPLSLRAPCRAGTSPLRRGDAGR